ncbi:terpene synthase family protein [Streptomyces alanosinicus]|uniref:Uncharacterized protein n=1 Tax=Streptomyces alanosinicus TaxID=68171 RepID=A0A918YUM0_9ACTN|nr:hypothetical protein [Streptomyces alanosinicus]GHE15898.1 hypothetical protein GCM10010339_92040 [Streptomyces alanosinicus]
MPQDIEFGLPFAPRISPDLDGARRRDLDWVRKMRLVVGRQGLDWYRSWDMARLAAYGFPYARGPELDLCTNAMAFSFIFDDQFDGPLDLVPHDVARHRSANATEQGSAQVSGRAPWTMEQYLQVRRGIAANALPLSLGEHAAGIALPAAAFHSPQLRITRETAVDITLMCNDVYSLEKLDCRPPHLADPNTAIPRRPEDIARLGPRLLREHPRPVNLFHPVLAE